jgi:hypothetical protein
MRLTYLLLIPGWFCLATSIYYGMTVQQEYVAWLWIRKEDIPRAINSAAVQQGAYMDRGLSVFAVWMIIYLLWWVLVKKDGEQSEARMVED